MWLVLLDSLLDFLIREATAGFLVKADGLSAAAASYVDDTLAPNARVTNENFVTGLDSVND
jgi:hypothetical protein